MFIVAHSHKHEAILASTILLVATVLGILFFTNGSFRFTVLDAYNSVFKLVITDRVLQDDATAYSNIAYCNTDNPRQTLDLYVPKNAQQAKTKLVIFIHGGGWRAGDKSNQEMTYYGEHFLKNDIAVASLNYRLYPEVTYPEPNDDIACALRYLASHVGEYGVSDKKWVLFGDSAGAQLGAYAMGDMTINQPLQLFVGFYGPYDLPRQINRVGKGDRDAWNYTNESRDARNASPIYRNAKKDATYMLFHGMKDRIVSFPQSEAYVEKLNSDQISTIFTPVNQAGHYFSPRSEPTSEAIKKLILQEITKY